MTGKKKKCYEAKITPRGDFFFPEEMGPDAPTTQPVCF
jgi:hypothetical protein